VVIVPADTIGNIVWSEFGEAGIGQWRLHQILIQIMSFLPGDPSLTVLGERGDIDVIFTEDVELVFPEYYQPWAHKSRHHTAWSVMAGSLGADIGFFSASGQAKTYARQWIEARSEGRKCIALTLREAEYGWHRNAELEIWSDLARRLEEAGYFPVIVRDTDKALEPLPDIFAGISALGEAAFNLQLRMAFYQEAHICIFVSNGPGHMCFYNPSVRYLYNVTGEWSEGIVYKRWGLDKGENPPFVTRFQKWIWEPQSASNLLKYCVQLDASIGTSAGAEKRLASPITPAMVWSRNYECSRLTLHTRPEDIAFLTETYHLIDQADRAEPLLRLKWASLRFYFGDVVEAVTHILDILNEIGEAAFLGLNMNEEMYFPVGMTFEHLGNYRLAAEFYERANDKKKIDLSLLHRLGGVHKQLENYDRAAEIFEFLEKNDVDHPKVLSELADIRKRLGSH